MRNRTAGKSKFFLAFRASAMSQSLLLPESLTLHRADVSRVQMGQVVLAKYPETVSFLL
jgi:hypothetical protein